MNDDVLRMSPAEVAESATALDALAGRVEQLLQHEAQNLSVLAGARDEVSERVAKTLNDVHGQFSDSANRGVTEMRETAATLRSQARDVSHLDEGFAL